MPQTTPVSLCSLVTIVATIQSSDAPASSFATLAWAGGRQFARYVPRALRVLQGRVATIAGWRSGEIDLLLRYQIPRHLPRPRAIGRIVTPLRPRADGHRGQKRLRERVDCAP
jgi:hypothetical protein